MVSQPNANRKEYIVNIYLPKNFIVIPVYRESTEYYFILDSGIPSIPKRSGSFWAELPVRNELTGNDFGVGSSFRFQMERPPDHGLLERLSKYSGVKISGLLGLDFMRRFDTIVIDYNKSLLEFDTKPPDSLIKVKLRIPKHILADFAVEDHPPSGCSYIDTGLLQSKVLNRSLLSRQYLQSRGWKVPAWNYDKDVTYSADVHAKLGDYDIGKFCFGFAEKEDISLQAQYHYGVGANILSQFLCIFDMKNMVLLLEGNRREFRYGADLSPDLYSVGFQVAKRDGQLRVCNILPGNPNHQIKVNEVLEIEGIDINHPEVINHVYAKLWSKGSPHTVDVLVSRKQVTLTMSPMFTKDGAGYPVAPAKKTAGRPRRGPFGTS
jgi:hypothetical protein